MIKVTYGKENYIMIKKTCFVCGETFVGSDIDDLCPCCEYDEQELVEEIKHELATNGTLRTIDY